MKSIKLVFVRLGMRLVFQLRLYYFWSRLYRFLFENKYKKIPIPKFYRFSDLEHVLSLMRWEPDPITELNDAISFPGKMQYFFLFPEENHKGTDCDEFAVYAATVIERDFKEASSPTVMSIVWLDSSGKMHGHNVCAFQTLDKRWAHMGNWFKGEAQIGFPNTRAIAVYFSKYENLGGQLIGYCRVTPDLKNVVEFFLA